MVVVQGPRFSTRAESQWFARQGFTLVNMTGYPEAVLARELEMCYAAIALVTRSLCRVTLTAMTTKSTSGEATSSSAVPIA